MLDQLIIGDKSSFDDFDASVSERNISPPKKKEIKETVPFSNVTYDFSKINGELFWEVLAFGKLVVKRCLLVIHRFLVITETMMRVHKMELPITTKAIACVM